MHLLWRLTGADVLKLKRAPRDCAIEGTNEFAAASTDTAVSCFVGLHGAGVASLMRDKFDWR